MPTSTTKVLQTIKEAARSPRLKRRGSPSELSKDDSMYCLHKALINAVASTHVVEGPSLLHVAFLWGSQDIITSSSITSGNKNKNKNKRNRRVKIEFSKTRMPGRTADANSVPTYLSGRNTPKSFKTIICRPIIAGTLFRKGRHISLKLPTIKSMSIDPQEGSKWKLCYYREESKTFQVCHLYS